MAYLFKLKHKNYEIIKNLSNAQHILLKLLIMPRLYIKHVLRRINVQYSYWSKLFSTSCSELGIAQILIRTNSKVEYPKTSLGMIKLL